MWIDCEKWKTKSDPYDMESCATQPASMSSKDVYTVEKMEMKQL